MKKSHNIPLTCNLYGRFSIIGHWPSKITNIKQFKLISNNSSAFQTILSHFKQFKRISNNSSLFQTIQAHFKQFKRISNNSIAFQNHATINQHTTTPRMYTLICSSYNSMNGQSYTCNNTFHGFVSQFQRVCWVVRAKVSRLACEYLGTFKLVWEGEITLR